MIEATIDPLLNVELGKWPRLLIVGDSVTERQASEIILRTTTGLYGNDKPFLRAVCDLLGVQPGDYGCVEPGSFKRWRDSVNAIAVRYLENDRIMSSWVGGSRGWCDWDGRIGCATYNIGKWPHAGDVHGDWCLIARAWPFLNLRCQLVPDEGAGAPAVEWRVTGGTVDVSPPEGLLTDPRDPMFAFWEPHATRCVSVDRLATALAHVHGLATESNSD